MPVLYRKWATLRLRDLEGWVSEWALDDMYAGTGGQGALDGSYEAALRLELAKVLGIDLTGGAGDLYKCLDQILRPLVYRLLGEAGCPQKNH